MCTPKDWLPRYKSDAKIKGAAGRFTAKGEGAVKCAEKCNTMDECNCFTWCGSSGAIYKSWGLNTCHLYKTHKDEVEAGPKEQGKYGGGCRTWCKNVSTTPTAAPQHGDLDDLEGFDSSS